MVVRILILVNINCTAVKEEKKNPSSDLTNPHYENSKNCNVNNLINFLIGTKIDCSTSFRNNQIIKSIRNAYIKKKIVIDLKAHC